MKPDAIIQVRFLTSAEGGRKTAVEGQFYACPMYFDDKGFECRLLLDGKRLELGVNYDLPVKFMNRDGVVSLLVAGAKVMLWEGHPVAQGEVVRLVS